MILLVTELEELGANPDAPASGTVIESQLDPGRGPVVTILVQRGTLRVGDSLVAGPQWGRVRAMHDFTGTRVEEAVPGMPVEVLGFDGVADAGEFVKVVENDRRARQDAQERANRLKTEALARRQARKVSLEEVFSRVQEGEIKELNIVLKADVAGSLEALQDEIAKVPQERVGINVIHSQTGGINESDVMLAAASQAIVIGFNVRPLADARRAAEREGVDVRTYSVIYKITEDLRNAMEGMLEAVEVEETLGEAEVKQTFKASKVGRIAGCIVNEGKVTRTRQRAPGPRGHGDLGRQARLPAPLQRRRAGSRAGPGVRRRPRRLRGRQGGGRARVLRDQAGRADARVGSSMATPRMRRINEVLREVIGATIAKLSDPRIGFVTVTSVETSPDLRAAKVYFSVLGNEEEREATLTGCATPMASCRRRSPPRPG